jgi:hypothetical protein
MSHPDPCAATVAAIADFGAKSAPSTDLLQQIRHRFELLTAGPDPLSVDGAALGHGLPARPVPVPELAAVLLHPATSFPARDVVWRHLIGRARTDGPSWVVACVGVALPGLLTVTARMARKYDGDIAATVVTEFLAAVRNLDPHPPQVVSRLLNTTQSNARAALRAAQPVHCGEGAFAPVSTAPPAVFGHPDFVLARAVRDGVLTELEADVIAATRLEAVPVADYAARHQMSVWAVYRLRAPAEARLAAALRGGQVGDPVGEVVLEATTTCVMKLS